jgi:RHS repeat-associated protein
LSAPTTYTYDRDRRLTNIGLPSGQQISHLYVDGKKVQTTTPEGTRYYDYSCGAKLSQVSMGSETLSYGYDGDLMTGIRYTGLLEATINYRYNNLFQVDQVTYAGQSADLSYDNDGLVTQAGEFAITHHAEHGLPTELSDTQLTQALAYNGYGERTSSQTRFGSAAVYDYSLSYDNTGTIIGKTETLPDASTNSFVYGYDARKRLISVTKNGTEVEHYDYDENGNRSLFSSTERGLNSMAATYNAGDQLSTLGNTQYVYDANGRLSKKTEGTAVTTYQYSSTGQLLTVVTPEHTVEYQHNALGNRVAKKVDGNIVEKYLWQNKTTLLAIYDENDNLLQRFEYTLGQTPTAFTQGTNRYYIITDQIGTPRFITDETGTLVKQIDYDAYGNVIADTNPAMDIPFGFAGGLKDNHTGLIRFGYRDFAPETGRWTARDPIGFAGGDTNLYGYVGGNSIQFIDLSGLAKFGVRPLGPGTEGFKEGVDPWLGGNIQLAHEQLWFDDVPEENIGYFSKGPKYGELGIIRHDYGHKRNQYSMLPEVYEDYYMREAVAN